MATDPELLRLAIAGDLRRNNTTPGSPERKAVYAAEYARRNAQSRSQGLTFNEARTLREKFPLSPQIQANLARDHINKTRAHNTYAVLRAQIAAAQIAKGRRVSKPRQRAARTVRKLRAPRNPVVSLEQWYKQIQRGEFQPQDWVDTHRPLPTGGFAPSVESGTEEDYGNEPGLFWQEASELPNESNTLAYDDTDLDFGDFDYFDQEYDDDIWEFEDY